MSKVTYPTLNAPINWDFWLEERCLASAGPRASITGMRKKYWGDCPIVKCGQYIYRVTPEVYNTIKNRM